MTYGPALPGCEREESELHSQTVFNSGDRLVSPVLRSRSSLFVSLVLGSLIFHLGLIGGFIFFDPARRLGHPAVETPVELVTEEELKGGQGQDHSGQEADGDAHAEAVKRAEAAKAEAAAKEAEAARQQAEAAKQAKAAAEAAKQTEASSEKPQAEAEKPTESQSKTQETKNQETKAQETKTEESKSAEKPPEPKNPAVKAAQDQAKPEAPSEAQSPAKKPPSSAASKQAVSKQARAAEQKAQKSSAQKAVAQKAVAEAPRPTAPSPPPQQQSVAAQQSQPVQETRQSQDTVAAQTPPTAQTPGRLPAFLSQSMDNFTQAVPTAQPTNDQDAEPVSFRLLVFGSLERVKSYPESARRRHAGGHVVVSFVVDDAGQPQNVSLVQSSGEADLDVEALAMVVRAAPYPVPPAGAQRDLAIVIEFGGG